MNKAEKRKYIEEFCLDRNCSRCPLCTKEFSCGRGTHWRLEGLSGKSGDVDKAYEIVTAYEAKEREDFIKKNPDIIEIPVNATNGDVIKALFSVKSWEFRTSFTMSVQFEDICEIKLFPLEWWNAPYKKESEE